MRRDISLFLFLLGVGLFNWPLISIFKKSIIPYLFIVWLLFITLIRVFVTLSEKEEGDR
jgi:hypothetical protein